MIRSCAILALCFLASAASAQDVRDCDWHASARNLVEPWSDHTRTFANGKTRLALLDTAGEPAAGSYYLLVLSPPYAELGDRQCRVIGHGAIGFGYIDFENLDAAYDPANGLTFDVPVEIYDGETFVAHHLTFTLNQSTGEIVTRLFE
jgi:hypothetical protein